MDRLTRRSLVVRSLVIWLVLRIAFTAANNMIPVPGDSPGLRLEPAVVPLFAVCVGVAAVLDLRALGEDTLLANLGVGARHVFAVAFGLSVVLETVLAVGAWLA